MIRSCLRRKVFGQGGRIQEEEVGDVEDPKHSSDLSAYTYARSACFASSRTNVAAAVQSYSRLGGLAMLKRIAATDDRPRPPSPPCLRPCSLSDQPSAIIWIAVYSGHMEHTNTGTMG